METGEYRGFAGQFSPWLRVQLAIWRWPLLFSLLLHIGLFWPQSLQQNRPGASMGVTASALHARLRPAPQAAPRAEPAAVPPPVPAQRLMSQMQRNPAASAPALAPLRAEALAAPAAVLAPREAVASIDARFASSGLDAGAVRTYRLALARAIRGEVLRPRLPDPAFQGALSLGIAIGAAGQLRAVAVVRSSGSATADAAVLAMVNEAALTAPVPAAMRGRDFVIELPVEIGAALTAAADR